MNGSASCTTSCWPSPPSTGSPPPATSSSSKATPTANASAPAATQLDGSRRTPQDDTTAARVVPRSWQHPGPMVLANDTGSRLTLRFVRCHAHLRCRALGRAARGASGVVAAGERFLWTFDRPAVDLRCTWHIPAWRSGMDAGGRSNTGVTCDSCGITNGLGLIRAPVPGGDQTGRRMSDMRSARGLRPAAQSCTGGGPDDR